MGATPQYGSMSFKGASGRGYSVSVYISDVVGAYARFNQDGVAGTATPDFLVFPETVTIVDFSVVTGLADTKVVKILKNGVSTGVVLQDANHVNTLATRPYIGVTITAGSEIRMVQA